MLLFIGLDWCLRPAYRVQGSIFEQIPLLEDWLLKRPHVFIVISGQWRRHYALEALRSVFGAELRERVIGLTERNVLRRRHNSGLAKPKAGQRPRPFAEDLFVECCGYPAGERELEIWLWRSTSDMAHHTWRALDDRPWMYSQRCTEFLEVDRKQGITPDTLTALDEWLPPAGSGS
jgi:hypothetical protein